MARVHPRISPRAQAWQVEVLEAHIGKPFQSFYRNAHRPILIKAVHASDRLVDINDGSQDDVLTIGEALRLLDNRRF